MFKSVSRVKAALRSLPSCEDTSDSDNGFELKPKIKNLLNSTQFWNNIPKCEAALGPLANGIGYLEANSTPLSG